MPGSVRRTGTTFPTPCRGRGAGPRVKQARQRRRLGGGERRGSISSAAAKVVVVVVVIVIMSTNLAMVRPVLQQTLVRLRRRR